MQYASSEDYAKYCPGGTVPPEEQDAALDAASRDIDGLTFDRIVAAGFDRLTAFQQELVKRAVCEQAEFRSVYAELLASPFSSYSINGVAMQFDGAGIVERGGRIRRLMPRECLRLQGFEDEQIDRILAINSDAQAYKQAGNSVTVTMIEAIGRRIRAVDEELRKEAAA